MHLLENPIISGATMARPIARPMTPREFIRVMFRHRGKVLSWCCLIAIVAIAAIKLLPRKYESEAKLFLRLGRESVTLDPTATTGTTMQVQESREDQINSARDMLKSRPLLDRVVEKLGADTILNGPANSGAGSSGDASASQWMPALPSLSLLPPVSPAETAVTNLAKSIDVNVARNSSVISIVCTAKTARLAQQILETFLDAYQQQHIKANSTAGSLDFFTAQAVQLKERLDAAVAKLRDAKDASSVMAISVEQQAAQSQLTQVEAASLAADAAVASSEATLVDQRRTLSNIPERVMTEQTGGFPNPAADGMRQEYFKLQASLHEMEAKMQADHPLLQAAREQSKALEKIVDAQPLERSQTTTGANPSRQTLDLEMHREEAAASAWRAKASALKKQYVELQHRIQALNEHEALITELETQATIAQANYRSNAEHLEQARIGDALEAKRISNVNIIQPPSLVESPISPKPTLILGLSLLVAMFGSIGLAFGSEALHNLPATTDDAAPHLNGKVLESIPPADIHHVLLNR
jgi:uncharacterized protein involved in exopolysaccharide biosynthesis